MGTFNIRRMFGAAFVAVTLAFAPAAASATCKTPLDYEQIKEELVVLISVIEDQIGNYPRRSPIGRYLAYKLRSSQTLLARLERFRGNQHWQNPHKRHNVRGYICKPQVSKS